jgi:dTDP-4-amino-4,6-dideoxygalactose transaminase
MKTARRIPITKPTFGDEERTGVLDVLDSGWVLQGARVLEFESGFRDFVGSANAISTSSCTAALHSAVLALGTRPGDEVIVPAFTWVATANVVELVGATPVFCDIRADTFNIDERLLESRITERTVGVIPVHLFGLAAAMHEITSVAERHGLWIIEDAACALGSRIGGVHVGSFGSIGCFSFHPRKSITTGEGGMSITADDDLAIALRSIRDHGSAPQVAPDGGSWSMPAFPRLGLNYRMTDLQGAIGVAQMKRADGFIKERQRLAERYAKGLGDLPWLRIPTAPPSFEHAYQSYVCLVDPVAGDGTADRAEERDRLMGHLAERGIETRPGTHAPPFTAYYQERYGHTKGDFPISAMAEHESIALPLFPGLEDSDVDFVIDVLRTYR